MCKTNTQIRIFFKNSTKNYGANKIAMGSDYPFPLGEKHPGKLIESMNLDNNTKKRLLSGTALKWLGLKQEDILGT